MKSQFKRIYTLLRTKEKYLPLIKDKWKYLIAIILILLTKDRFPVLGNLITALTFIVLIHDTADIIRYVRAIHLIPNDDEKNSFIFSTEPRKQRDGEPSAGLPRILSLGALRPGPVLAENTHECIWIDEKLNRRLWKYADTVRVGMHKKKYQLPPDLAEIAAPVVAQAGRKAREGRSRAAYLFNGARARLTTEPSDLLTNPQIKLIFQRAMYFDLLSSNHLWHYSRDIPIPEGGFRIPLQHTVDFDRRLLRLDESRLANTVGISCLVVTSDGWIIFVVQSERNAIHPSAIAPSGSGSLDWRDVTQELKAASNNQDEDSSLRDLVFRGMLREVEEETAASSDAIDPKSWIVTSYFRWLSRGAKPEFTGLARSQQSWDEICSRSLQSDEMLYTKSRLKIPVSFLMEAVNTKEDVPGTVEVARLRDKLVEVASSHVSAGANSIEPGSISVSTAATWLAAVEFLKQNPAYLDKFREV